MMIEVTETGGDFPDLWIWAYVERLCFCSLISHKSIFHTPNLWKNWFWETFQREILRGKLSGNFPEIFNTRKQDWSATLLPPNNSQYFISRYKWSSIIAVYNKIHKFWETKTICSVCCGLKVDRLSDTAKPHLERIRSLATDVAGMIDFQTQMVDLISWYIFLWS